MSGALTIYCGACQRPLLLVRRGMTYPVAGVDVLEADREGIVRVRCVCAAIWERTAAARVIG